MVSWVGDGLMSGYDPITMKWKAGMYRLASPGSVDLKAITRLRWDWSGTYYTFPNRLDFTANLRLVASDWTGHSTKKIAMTALLVKASVFAPGVVPTPTQLFNAPSVAFTLGSRYASPSYVGDLESNLNFANRWIEANTKYWVLLYPALLSSKSPSTGDPWSKTTHAPLGNINTNGRAVSFWANRTPEAPVITSPLPGTLIPAGGTFNLTFDPKDPDKVSPDDALRSNQDLAGVMIEYAPLPTPENPDPFWGLLPYKTPKTAPDWDGYSQVAKYSVGYAKNKDRIRLIRDRGCPILCGVDEEEAPDFVGLLPPGDWQLRVRTYDFGHPYPNIANPLGVSPAWDTWNFPDVNTSPWSEPVRVSVSTQVPPPVPITPKDRVAVPEGGVMRLSWQYRNTVQPPNPQDAYWVQARKVGDPEWSTVAASISGDNFIDLPSTIAESAISPSEYLTDLGFEEGTLGGWASLDLSDLVDPIRDLPASSPEVSLANVTSPPPHSGLRHLRTVVSPARNVSGVFIRKVPALLDSRHDTFDLRLSARSNTTPTIGSIILVQMYFWDSSGNSISRNDETNADYLNVLLTRQASGEYTAAVSAGEEGMVVSVSTDGDWASVDISDFPTAPGAVGAVVFAYSVPADWEFGTVVDAGLDDVSLIGRSSFSTVGFTFEATTQYEWRVAARDSSGKRSEWSQPARFWVVSAGASGEVKPVPSQTIEGATLGCGTHRVFVYRRGGSERVGELRNISHVDWSRVRDDISTSKVVISGWDVDCGNLLARLQTWAYELVIFRDNGYSVDRVWEGPITLLTYEDDKVTIQAKDVMGYAYRRIIKQKMTDSGKGNGTTVVDRARRVLQNTFAPDDPNVLAYLQVLAREDDAMQYRSTPAYSRTAFEEVDDMAANSGLDYTVVGRSILLWGTKHRIGTLPEFRDENLGASPIVSEYGMSMSNRYAVSDGNGVYGEAVRLDETEVDPIYGLVEMLSSTWASDSDEDSGTYTQAGLETVRRSFRDFAERSIADRYPPPMVVRVPDNTSLNPNTVLSIQQLVPGVVIPLRSTGTLRTVSGNQKLDSVRVNEEAGAETITITLSPFNRDDAAIVEGGGE